MQYKQFLIMDHLYAPSSIEIYQSNSDSSSGYEKMLHDKSMQLTELQLYINNIARCLEIVDIISARIHEHS